MSGLSFTLPGNSFLFPNSNKMLYMLTILYSIQGFPRGRLVPILLEGFARAMHACGSADLCSSSYSMHVALLFFAAVQPR